MIRPLLLLLSVLSLFITSCQKEPDGSVLTPPTPKCQLVRAEYLDGQGGVDDTSGYVYSGDRLTLIKHIGHSNSLEYTNDRISKKFYQDAGSPSADAYDQFTYNPDGTLSKADFYVYGAGQVPVLLISIEITYSGGKPTKVTEKADTTSTGTGPLVALGEYTYTYTGNNITRTVVKDLIGNTTQNIDYEYDSNANFFPKNPSTLLTDLLFEDYAGDLLPFVFSANNVTKAIQAGSPAVNVSYVTDSNKNLTEFRINGMAIVKYTHKCQ